MSFKIQIKGFIAMIHLLFIIYIKEFLKDLVVSSKDFLKYYTCSYTSLWPESRSRRFWYRSLWTSQPCFQFSPSFWGYKRRFLKMSTFLQIWSRPSCPGVGCHEFHKLDTCTSNHRDAIGICNSWLCILKMKLKMLNSLRTTAIA